VGLDLAVVDDKSENDFLERNILADAFIGLTDRSKEGAWKWISDGSLTWCGGASGRAPGADVFTHWSLGQPATARCRASSRGDSAYWFCDDLATFEQARASCAGTGMTLARPGDAAENSYIGAALPLFGWLGATDAARDGE
jgi:hypothetical protein